MSIVEKVENAEIKTVKLLCPNCKVSGNAPANMEGKNVKCKACEFVFLIEKPKQNDFIPVDNIVHPIINQKVKIVEENRCTCTTCGHIWHYGAQEIAENTNKAIQSGIQACDQCTCPCCWAPSFMPEKPNPIDLNKCPKCGSKAVKVEKIKHNLPC
jgi:hypothetical protein